MIIIDANVAQEFTAGSDEAKAITTWILGRGRVSTGGRNLEELVKTPIREFILQLDRAGKLLRAQKEIVDAMEIKIARSGIQSDDPHVIALAHVSGARLLYTKDRALIVDFTSTKNLPRPRGKCYRYAQRHKHLLR